MTLPARMPISANYFLVMCAYISCSSRNKVLLSLKFDDKSRSNTDTSFLCGSAQMDLSALGIIANQLRTCQQSLAGVRIWKVHVDGNEEGFWSGEMAGSAP